MKLSEAIARGVPLLVIIDDINQRYAAEAWITDRGFAFADTGWDELAHPGHPFHLIEGPIGIDGPPWKVGEVLIDIVTEADAANAERRAWEHYRKTAEGKKATRKAALAAFQRDLGPFKVLDLEAS